MEGILMIFCQEKKTFCIVNDRIHLLPFALYFPTIPWENKLSVRTASYKIYTPVKL